MKICTKCGVEKGRDEFRKRPERPIGISSWCLLCLRARDIARISSPEFKEYRRTMDALPHNVERRRKYMKTEAFRISIEKHRATPYYKEMRPKHSLNYLYKMSSDQYEKMNLAQGGLCAICRKQNRNGNRLCVDHNHATGKVRALLCSSCNLVIGHAKENPEILREAIRYVERWNGSATADACSTSNGLGAVDRIGNLSRSR